MSPRWEDEPPPEWRAIRAEFDCERLRLPPVRAAIHDLEHVAPARRESLPQALGPALCAVLGVVAGFSVFGAAVFSLLAIRLLVVATMALASVLPHGGA